MKPPFFRSSVLTVCLAVMAFCLPALAQAATLTVPAQYPTIQAAINAAQNGDTVLIADGTYTGDGSRDIDFGGKNITVTSQHGATSTIIDCQGSSSANHRGFYIHSGETNAVISGLTIKNGYEEDATGTQIKAGGGIIVRYGNAIVKQCVVINSSADEGGGIAFGNSNSDTASSSMTVIDCTIAFNTAKYGCGGVSIQSYNIGFNNSVIALSNCVISSNTSQSTQSYGGGLSISNVGSMTVLTNCTITQNTAHLGNGIYENNSGGGSLVLVNNVIYGDAGNEIESNYGSTSSTFHCDIQGGYPGTNNINADPKFVSATDFHLKADSPCLGAGTHTGAPEADKDGNTRPSPPSIGAYEYITPVPTDNDIFVSSGFDNGSSTIEEYTPSGQHVRSIAVPANTGSSAGDGTEYLRGIAANDAGQLVGFNGTFSPELATFLPSTRTFTARTAPNWRIANNGSSGTVGVSGAYSFVLMDHFDSSSPPSSIIRFNPDGTSQKFGTAVDYRDYINLTVGMDGNLEVLYSVPGRGFTVDVYNPISLQLLRTIPLQVPSQNAGSSTDLRNLTVDATGSLYVIDLYSSVYHLDASGNLLKAAAHGHGGFASDIKIDPVDGRILISFDGYGGAILQTDASLSSFTTLIQFDPNLPNSNFITFGNAKLAAALNSQSHIQWNNTDGMLSLWSQNVVDGTYSHREYGPYARYTAKAIADGGTDGKTRVLWNKSDKSASIWSLDNTAGQFTHFEFGPFTGYIAAALSVAADNTTHVLWTNTDGTASVWNYAAASGRFTHKEYGPYAGWTAKAIADGPDGKSRLLWTKADGTLSLWSFDNSTGVFNHFEYGPFAGWTAGSVSVGGDNTTHVLWTNTSGAASVWNDNLRSGSYTHQEYGPYAGWTANAISDGADGKQRVLWDNADGRMSLWGLDNTTGIFGQFTYGPYSGWTATTVSGF